MTPDTGAGTTASRHKKIVITITLEADVNVDALRLMHEALVIKLTSEQLRLLASYERDCRWPDDTPPTLVIEAGPLWDELADEFLDRMEGEAIQCEVKEVMVEVAETETA